MIDIGQIIHDKIVLSIALFPKLPTSPTDLQGLLDAADDAYLRKASKAVLDTAEWNVARKALEDALGSSGNGGYVNTVAKGDQMIVLASGYPFFETGSTPDFSAPNPPLNLRLRATNVVGQTLARYLPQRSRSMNEVQICLGDPNTEADWKTIGMFSGGRAMIPGITPGTTIWVRVRTAGLKNVMSSWSSTAKIVVT